MKFLRNLCVIAVLLVLAFAPAALAATGSFPPNLLGVWEGFSAEIREDRRFAAPFRIDITRQEGTLLWAEDVWRPWDAATGKLSTATRRDPLLGSLNPEGSGGILVKQDARFALRIIDADRIEVEFVSVRPDSPAAFYTVLSRTGSTTAATVAASPDLAGSWRSPYRYPGVTGPLDSQLRLDVVRQDGELLWADDIWNPVDPATGKPGTSVLKDRLVGSLSPDGTRGVLAKADARFSLRVLDTSRIEVEFSRIGGTAESATAFYQTLDREGRGAGPEPGTATPAFLGTWEGASRYAQPDGVKSGTFRLEVTRQDGLLLWVDDVWFPIDPATGKTGTVPRRDPLVGSLQPDGRGGLLVKTGARFAFRFLAPDKILVEFVRLRVGGQIPTAFYTVLDRVNNR